MVKRVQAGTDSYHSNAKNGKERYRASFNYVDAPNVIRFLKKEAPSWGCTGYTDIYVITIDEYNHVYNGGDAGLVQHKPVDLDYLFPIQQYRSDWVPHWKMDRNEWDGETLNRKTLPIPNKPHQLSELAYPNHMIPDINDTNSTCTLRG